MSEKASARLRRIMAFQNSVRLHEDDPEARPIFERMRAIHDSNPEARKLAKEANDRAAHLASCSMMNGPDLFVDRYLRSFLAEYNSRLFKGNGDKQPTSFNVAGAFIEPDEITLVLKLLPENHISLHLETLLDQITDPDVENSLDSLTSVLEELEIYEYHVIGGYAKIKLGALDLTFHGAAFVRDLDEISIIGIFGKKVEKLETRKNEELPDPFPGKEFLASQEPVDLSDIEIVENSNRVPLITMSRISITDKTSQVRYALLETKDTFKVLTNDPQVHSDMLSMRGGDKTVKNTLELLNDYIPAIEFTEQIPYFHIHFENFEDYVKVVRQPTFLKINSNSSVVKKIKKNLKVSECPNYIEVKTIDTPRSKSNEYELRPQNLKIEERGYWKILPNFMAGTDRNGNEVHGKSWVDAKESWYEITNANYPSDQNIKVEIRKSSSPGTVYVLRNAQHPKNTYKIGFTTKSAEERASQLSSTSGQPDSFGVMRKWHVEDPRAVEQEVHRRLSAYRVNDKREFFRLDYELIQECIQSVIDAIQAPDSVKPPD